MINNSSKLAIILFDSYFCATESNIKFIDTNNVILHIEKNLLELLNHRSYTVNYEETYTDEYILDRLDNIVSVLELVYFESRASMDFDPSGIREPTEYIVRLWLLYNNYKQIINFPDILHNKIFNYLRPSYINNGYEFLTDRGKYAFNKMTKILNEIIGV